MATKKLKLDPTGRFPQTIGPDDEPETKTVDAQTALLERIAKLEGALTGVQTQLTEKDRTINSLMSTPVVKYEAPVQPQKKTFRDPVNDPDGYAEDVRNDILAQIKQDNDKALAGQNEAQAYNNRLTALWNDFATENPEYAKNQEGARLAAEAVALEAQQRGMDVNKYMFGASGEFKQAVKIKMDKLGMAPKVAADDDEAEDDDEPRTMGIFGGLESGGNKTGAKVEDKPGSLFDGLKEWQVEHGFHR